METQHEFKSIREEDLTPAQRERLIAFYKMLLENKRAGLEEMRQIRETPAYKEAMERLEKRNAERGTPII